MKLGYVYMHTSPSGKAYIGVSCREKGIRWKEHVANAYDPSKVEYGYPFQQAIRKYGEGSFKSVILKEDVPMKELYELEIEYVAMYNTFKNGYNQTAGGIDTSKWAGVFKTVSVNGKSTELSGWMTEKAKKVVVKARKEKEVKVEKKPKFKLVKGFKK